MNKSLIIYFLFSSFGLATFSQNPVKVYSPENLFIKFIEQNNYTKHNDNNTEKEIQKLNQNIKDSNRLNQSKNIIELSVILILTLTLIMLIIIIKKNKKVSKLLDEENQYNSNKVALADIIETSIKGIDLKEFLNIALVRILATHWLPAETKGSIFLTTKEGELKMVAHKKLDKKYLTECAIVKPGECICGLALTNKKSYIGNYQTKFKEDSKINRHKHIKKPIILENEVLGLLNLYIDKNVEINNQNFDFLDNVCFSLANIIKQKQLRKQLQKQKNDQDVLNQQLFAQSIEIDQRNIEMENINKELEKQKTQLTEAVATKDKFFSIIAHDLRSPFNAIFGFSNMLLTNHSTYDEERREKMINNIRESAKKTFTLVENLLEWARSQTGKVEYKPNNYGIKELTSETIFEVEDSAKNKEIQLKSLINENFPIFCDKNMFKTILRNLITNAIKFTHNNGLIILNSIEKTNEIVFSVSDTGVGMDKEKITELFDITKKTSTEGTNYETGTGLGLLLCKEFTEKMGGKIEVESQEGKGSIFSFSIPKV